MLDGQAWVVTPEPQSVLGHDQIRDLGTADDYGSSTPDRTGCENNRRVAR